MKKIYSFLIASLFSVMLVSAAPTTGLQFSGTATSIIALDPQPAFSPTEFTVEVWVNYQALNGGGYIISTEGWSPTNHGFSLRLNGNKLNFAIGEGTNWVDINSSADITTNTWFHAAVTCSATEMKMFINGVEDATKTITAPMAVSTDKITLGDSPAWPGRLFIGKMGDLRFWNVARTQAEIAADMTSQLTGTESGLVAGWKMNEGTGTAVADVKGAYNITKPADVSWFVPSIDEEITIIEPTKGLIFNGQANSLVDLGNNAAITSPAEFTLEAQVNFTSLTGGYILASEGWGTGGMGFALRIDNSKINFNTGAGSNWVGVSAPTNAELNKWTHIAVAYSATMMSLYVNGLEVASLPNPTPMSVSTQNLIMGEGAMWRGRGLIGKLGYVRMWSVAKTKQEIRDNANVYVNGSEANLLAAWNNDVKDVTILADKKATYPGTIGADVAWFGLTNAVNSVYNNSINIESAFYGRTVEVSNKTNGRLQFAIYNATGQKVMSDYVNAGSKLQKELRNMNGSYILKAVAEDGSIHTKKFIVTK